MDNTVEVSAKGIDVGFVGRMMANYTATTTPLAERVKALEDLESTRAIDFVKPVWVIARLDGRSFSKYTKDLEKPFDDRFEFCMDSAAKALLKEFKPDFVYTQSDEITMVWGPKASPEAEFLFGGRYQKLTSVLASFCSVNFYRTSLLYLHWKDLTTPVFDCRVWAVGSIKEAIDVVVWRYRDAIKNSISALAQAHFSPKQLHGLHAGQRLELLLTNGIDYNDTEVVAERSRAGVFFVSRPESAPLTEAELAKIPPEHRPVGPVTRSVIKDYYIGNESSVRTSVKLWLGGFDTEPKA